MSDSVFETVVPHARDRAPNLRQGARLIGQLWSGSGANFFLIEEVGVEFVLKEYHVYSTDYDAEASALTKLWTHPPLIGRVARLAAIANPVRRHGAHPQLCLERIAGAPLQTSDSGRVLACLPAIRDELLETVRRLRLAGLEHWDLGPHNVMVQRRGERCWPVLLDFGACWARPERGGWELLPAALFGVDMEYAVEQAVANTWTRYAYMTALQLEAEGVLDVARLRESGLPPELAWWMEEPDWLRRDPEWAMRRGVGI